jgi:UDP:flavonoid glycosyltransferase YjiC (YdhE family)
VESGLTANCAERLGAALVLRGSQTALSVAAAIHQVADGGRYKAHAREFAERYRDYDPAAVADEVVARIESASVVGPLPSPARSAS